MSIILSLESISKKFNDTYVVSNISFKLKTNQTLGILGPNGCGKTTTMGMILGLIKPTLGKILIDSKELDSSRNIKILQAINFASPYIDLPKRLSVFQNLKIYAMLYSVKNISERIQEISQYLQLEKLYNKPVGELSSGQKTRVSLAKALINKPKILLLDEPTASLDPYIGEYVRNFIEIYKKKNNLSMLIASHNMLEVQRLCDEIIIMDKGKIIDSGKPLDLIKKYKKTNLEETFLKMLEKNEI